ncbi:Hpt domain-containing protein [Paracoccus siganidrum]|uniref:Hpt domain-containing protein n=1 Tax=Paracoccus siganidrum TaxID=1276757 RepID=A0A419AB27_9RHOB|nr:Hpt domain-containing protein [Paracoccus siganidrum]RJL20472.1 Hpt domain-containing protein [Paracoccus siganidrum]RMC39424.1 hypothetical protein C9E82_04465 [Paracoccus siganidrum]
MIDWGRVVQLRDEVGAAEFGPLLELFLDEVEVVVMRLQAADPAKLADDLHFIRGSAANLGFSGLAALCRDAETALARRMPQAVCLDRLRGCYARSKQIFLRDLAHAVGPDLIRDIGAA